VYLDPPFSWTLVSKNAEPILGLAVNLIHTIYSANFASE